MRLAFSLLGAALLLLAGGCTREPAHLPPRTNIFVIVLDACRADGLRVYGGPPDASPALDVLSAYPDARVFAHHHAAAAATRASTASLFTGLSVREHGVPHPMRRPGLAPPEVPLLAARFDTLAEHLRAHGFHTVAVVNNPHLRGAYGYGQGFDVYDDITQLASDQDRVARFLELVRASPMPVFGYLHLIACHNPYAVNLDSGYLERHGFPYDEESRRAAGIDFRSADVIWRLREGRATCTEADQRFAHLLFGARMRWVDDHLMAPLLADLRNAGRYDDSVIAVTADHGEELCEHGGYAHGVALWEEVLHVPLIVKFPPNTAPGAFTDRLTSAVDLMPALLDLVGVPRDAALSQQALFFDGTTPPAGPRQAWAEGGDGGELAPYRWTYLSGAMKLIGGAGPAQLFDLDADPGERRDLAPTRPDLLATLSAAAESWRGQRPAREVVTVPADLPAAAVEQLRVLGYGSPER